MGALSQVLEIFIYQILGSNSTSKHLKKSSHIQQDVSSRLCESFEPDFILKILLEFKQVRCQILKTSIYLKCQGTTKISISASPLPL